MATFHVRRFSDRWAWRLLDEHERGIAASADTYPSRMEALNNIELMRRALSAGDVPIVFDTTVPAPRWRTIDPATGVAGDYSPEPEETHDEGETGPPEVDLTPKDAA